MPRRFRIWVLEGSYPRVGLDVAEAQHLMDGLDWQGGVKDIKASVDWLKANGSSKLADPAQAKAPVQAHFGELDNFVVFSDVTASKALEEKMKSSGVPSEVYIYPGNGHFFMNRSPDGVKRRTMKARFSWPGHGSSL